MVKLNNFKFYAYTLSLVSVLCFSLACDGAKTPGPEISRFEVVPSVLEVGEQAVLKAIYTGGDGRVDPQVGPVVSGQDVNLEATSSTTYTLTVSSSGGVSTTAQASVIVKPGLLVKIEGLPSGLNAAVTVVGPDGFTQALTCSQALKGLKPGRYVVNAAMVLEGTVQRPPLQLSQAVDLTTTGVMVKVLYPAPTRSFNLPGGVPLEFVLIPPGSFMMGPISPDQTGDWILGGNLPENSLPRHQVAFAKAFYLAKYPITIRQWKAVTNWTSPAYLGIDLDAAVWNRTWFEWRLDFLPALSKLVPDQAFRMPSEAEWEYALRAGSTSKYFWGDDFLGVDTYCWTWRTTWGANNTYPRVGLKQPNAWGLHDMFMTGQFLEDDSHANYIGAPADGSAWIDTPRAYGQRNLRGASWASNGPEDYAQRDFDSAYRAAWAADAGVIAGFRPALGIPE